jgi:hypothetical protein
MAKEGPIEDPDEEEADAAPPQASAPVAAPSAIPPAQLQSSTTRKNTKIING